MRILGLDISTKTGWAIVDTSIVTPSGKGRVMDKGVIHFPPTKNQAASDPARFGRYSKYLFAFDALLLNNDIGFIVVEGYGYANPFSLVTLVEIGTLLRMSAHGTGIRWREVPPTSLKKFVTGKGNAKKNLMLLNVKTRFDEDCETDDEADAVALAYYGLAIYGQSVPLPKAHLVGLDLL